LDIARSAISYSVIWCLLVIECTTRIDRDSVAVKRIVRPASWRKRIYPMALPMPHPGFAERWAVWGGGEVSDVRSCLLCVKYYAH
jgi:hypothetical protein